MKIRLAILGIEVFCLEFMFQDPLDLLARAMANRGEEEEEERSIGGGQYQCFERDLSPVDPLDRYVPDEEFGFH